MYARLDKKRAGYLGQLTTLTRSINSFDIATSSLHSIQLWRESLNDVKQKHQLVVEEIMDDDEADYDKIHHDEELFSSALFTASCSLENCSALALQGELRSIESLLTAFEEVRDANDDEMTTDELISRLNDLKPMHANYISAWNKCNDRSNNAQKISLNASLKKFSSDYYALIGWLTQEIKRKSPESLLEPTALGRSTTQSVNVRLPTIELEKFDGSPDKWVTFRDSFKSLIHNQLSLSGSTKFRYLKTTITDKHSPITHLLETDDGYGDAWNAVLAYYDDKRRILDGHFGAMLTAKRMTGETHEELQRITNDFTLNTASIERMYDKDFLYDALVAHLVIFRLDNHTRDLWETVNKNQVPSWPDLQKFLQERRKTLSTMPAPKVNPKQVTSTKNLSSTSNKSNWRSSNVNAASKSTVAPNSLASTHQISATAPAAVPAVLKCLMCSGNHRLNACNAFLQSSISDRSKLVRDWKICTNCFGRHAVDDCKSLYTCRSCHQRHHTMLHHEMSSAMPIQSNTSCNTITSSDHDVTLLQTALVNIRDSTGSWHTARAFLDSGADSNFISTDVAKALKLKLREAHVEASGLGGARLAVIRNVASASISNDDRLECYEMEFLVTPKVTNPTPIVPINKSTLKIPSNVLLADPNFDVPGKIDILLGNKIFGKLMRDGKLNLPSGITLLNTMFGWVFSGSAPSYSPGQRIITTTRCHHSSLGDLRESIEKFYKLEDYRNDKRYFTDEETHCERFFEQTHRRTSEGRFEIQIPFKDNLSELVNNYSSTLSQFLSNEKRLQRNEPLREKYVEFMREYEQLGHMTEVDVTQDAPETKTFYFPHHAVEKPDSTTTKVRIVFNGSSKTASGLSLNDTQCIGPQVQTDSFSLAIRFRQHPIAIKADIAKMYRQIEIAKHQRPLQRIFWRESPRERLKIFELNTVTYGTSSAAYEATRSLKQAGIDCSSHDPQAAHEIINNFYVDDWLGGESTVSSASKLSKKVINVLSQAGMKLRKFSSNNQEFLETIPESDREFPDVSTSLKALGDKWNPLKDTIGCEVNPMELKRITRRGVLSEISRIYDPEGKFGPVIFNFKIFLKKVCQLKTSWDELLPDAEAKEWIEIASTFNQLEDIEIPRHFVVKSPTNIQLHGFCDASDKGYGAAIYIFSENSLDERECHLVCAKSRVAPTEFRSTARLELNGAVLVANLMETVEKALTLPISKRICWTDSTIVLHWLMKSPASLQIFVANRVSEIQEKTKQMFWRHIRTHLNPADFISRGLSPSELIDCMLWWHGPEFLLQTESQWPATLMEIDPNDLAYSSEFKKFPAVVHVATPEDNPFLKWIEDSSRLWTAKRKLSHVMRFLHNVRSKRLGKTRRAGPIQVDDMNEAEIAFVRIYQQKHFREEIKCLLTEKSISPSSHIKRLSPIWDSKLKIIRVGGRLNQAPQCSEDQKHPILLPNCHLAKLVIREIHQKNLHGGQSATLGIVRMKFWPLRAKQVIKSQIHRCIKCFRVRPIMIEQFMGSLPASRVTPAAPFLHTGVDYCGPFNIKVSTIRNAKSSVAYVALFVCLTTKAIHLELVSKLSTAAFFCAFDKFISRRGFPHTMNSDNGLNFVGASNDMKQLQDFLQKSTIQEDIRQYFLRQEIEWKFIPPRAPEHGGLWEAGVKSMKHHFTRIAGNSLLTFEEFDQLKSKIEAVLNSRPLTALSDDPNDFSALTAGHFLIGRPLVAKPERSLVSESLNRLQRWDRISQMQQHFWQRWNHEYLHQLQVRTKNFEKKIPVSVGQLVLLNIDNCPPLMWPLGRITKIYPGKDGITRVASIKTTSSTYERPVTKLAILPIDADDDQLVPPENVAA